MSRRGLEQAIERGEPLADVIVQFRATVDVEAATRTLNDLADDFELYPGPWYGDRALRIGTATKDALERLFQWRIVRVPLERYDDATKTWSTWPRTFRWNETTAPKIPESLAQVIAAIGLTQPGANDDGQWYDFGTSNGPSNGH
jgi:hypothetical protein